MYSHSTCPANVSSRPAQEPEEETGERQIWPTHVKEAWSTSPRERSELYSRGCGEPIVYTSWCTTTSTACATICLQGYNHIHGNFHRVFFACYFCESFSIHENALKISMCGYMHTYVVCGSLGMSFVYIVMQQENGIRKTQRFLQWNSAYVV